MERRKFLKGMAVLTVLPIVGIAEETYPLRAGFDWDSLADEVKAMNIYNNTHTVKINKNRRSYSSGWVVDMDMNSMYMMQMAPIGA